MSDGLHHIDLFSGIGGFALACKWNGIKTIQFVEIDKRCRNFLSRAWPGVPIHDDVRSLVILCEEFVHIAGNERYLRVTPDVSRAIQHIQESGETKIENYISKNSGNITEEENRKSSTITAESASAVGSIAWSSFAWIINSITAMRNESDITIPPYGKSQSSEDCQTTCNSSATTATTPSRCTEYALIKIDSPFLLTGGTPCQPASRAGKQRGDQDDRWLWPSAIAMLKYAKPAWAIFENPPGIGDVGLAGILSDVEAQGYEVRVFGVPACAVGSPQIRMRYWIVANNSGERYQNVQFGGAFSEARGEAQESASERSESIMADAPRRQDDCRGHGNMAEAEGCGRGSDTAVGGVGEYLADPETAKHELLSERSRARREGLADHPARQWDQFVWLPCADGKVRRAPDDLVGLVNGVSVDLFEVMEQEGWPHRSILGALGNSIVPQLASRIIEAIVRVEYESE